MPHSTSYSTLGFRGTQTPAERKALAALPFGAAKPPSLKQELYRAQLWAQNRKQDVNSEVDTEKPAL